MSLKVGLQALERNSRNMIEQEANKLSRLKAANHTSFRVSEKNHTPASLY